MADQEKTKSPNDERSEAINPTSPKHQAALKEHSRRSNPEDPSNRPAATRPSSPPGKGKP
ncbi:hypothetical protein [Archangium sp.]|uniref:hypothetical protein n=1 Tax=Archangium sp. TaxID=1872627 RepID=UPI002ED87BA2